MNAERFEGRFLRVRIAFGVGALFFAKAGWAQDPLDARLAEASRALSAGEAAQAEKILTDALPPLEDYRALQLARARLALGKKDKAFAALEKLTAPIDRCGQGKELPDHLLYVDAVLLKADILAETEPSAAAELLAALPAAGDTLGRALELYRRGGDGGQAAAIEARLLTEVPDSVEARSLAKQLKAPGVKTALRTNEARLSRARKLLEVHLNAEARNEALALAKEVGDKSEHHCELLFIAGKAERKLRNYKGAVKTLEGARTHCASAKKEDIASRAALLEAQVRGIRGETVQIGKIIQWMTKLGANPTFLDDALLLQANGLDDSGRVQDAKPLYEKILALPKNDQGGEAGWRLARIAFGDKNYPEAIRRLTGVLERSDTGSMDRGRARYWVARAHVLSGDKTRAQRAYEELTLEPSFYGMVALDRLEKSEPAWAKTFRTALLTIRDTEGSPPALNASAITTAVEYDRAMRLFRAGAALYAESELERLVGCVTTDDEVLALALGFDAVGAYPRAQMLLRGRTGMLSGPLRPERLRVWRAAYSKPYFDLVEKAATASKVEPLFLLALVREESTFDPKIVSWAGATGLAQLMPGTAMLAHQQLGLGKLDMETLTDPGLNLRLGAHVLRDGMKDFGNREPLALAAYNGGPGVAKRLTEKKAAEFDAWVEDISIRETQRYIKRVTETWGIYRYLYDPKNPFVDFPDNIGNAQ